MDGHSDSFVYFRNLIKSICCLVHILKLVLFISITFFFKTFLHLRVELAEETS